MSGKTILENNNLQSQDIDSVKSFLKYMHRPIDPMPKHIDFQDDDDDEGRRLVLALSSKEDIYYCCNRDRCSCPSSLYRPERVCKHRQRFFRSGAASDESTRWNEIPRDGFRPVDEAEVKAEAV